MSKDPMTRVYWYDRAIAAEAALAEAQDTYRVNLKTQKANDQQMIDALYKQNNDLEQQVTQEIRAHSTARQLWEIERTQLIEQVTQQAATIQKLRELILELEPNADIDELLEVE